MLFISTTFFFSKNLIVYGFSLSCNLYQVLHVYWIVIVISKKIFINIVISVLVSAAIMHY